MSVYICSILIFPLSRSHFYLILRSVLTLFTWTVFLCHQRPSVLIFLVIPQYLLLISTEAFNKYLHFLISGREQRPCLIHCSIPNSTNPIVLIAYFVLNTLLNEFSLKKMYYVNQFYIERSIVSFIAFHICLDSWSQLFCQQVNNWQHWNQVLGISTLFVALPSSVTALYVDSTHVATKHKLLVPDVIF